MKPLFDEVLGNKKQENSNQQRFPPDKHHAKHSHKHEGDNDSCW